MTEWNAKKPNLAIIGCNNRQKGTLSQVIEMIERLEKFEAIGTIEEYKALKEKAEPKKPKKQENRLLVAEGWSFACPSCGCGIGVNERNEEYTQEDEYCPNCGQCLDWQ